MKIEQTLSIKLKENNIILCHPTVRWGSSSGVSRQRGEK